MNYVFQVHSPITVYGAIKYISINNLPLNQCFLLCWRDAENYFDSKIYNNIKYTYADKNIDFKYFLDFNFYDLKKIFFYKKQINQFNNWLNTMFAFEEFIYVVPHLNYFRDRMIIENNNCKGFYYIEEGLGGYSNTYMNKKNDNSLVDFKNNIKKYIIFKKDLSLSIELFPKYKKYLGVICFSDKSHSFLDKRINIGLPFNNIQVDSDVQHIIVVDTIININIVDTTKYFQILELLFNYFHLKKINKIHYKLHPGILKNDTLKKEIYKLFDDSINKYDIEFVMLDNRISLENIAYTLKSEVSFYGFFSVALLYTYFCGSKTYFLSNYLLDIDEKFNKYFNTYPDIFLNLANKNKLNIKSI